MNIRKLWKLLSEQPEIAADPDTDTEVGPDVYPEPYEEPTKTPSPGRSPFRVPRPEVEPSPQNTKLREGYEDEAHHGTVSYFRKPRDPHHADHPVLSKHGHSLADAAFNNTDQRVKSKNTDMRRLMGIFMEIMGIEAEHQQQLVKLAIDAVAGVWGIDPNSLNAQLSQEMGGGGVDHNDTNDRFAGEEGAQIDDRVRGHIHMRATMNMLTHGAAIHHMMTIHHSIAEGIKAIEPRLMDLYDQLAGGSVHQYWFMDIERMASMLKQMAVGSARVDWDEDEDDPKVVARAVCLPVLCQELSKGVMMLLSSHHLSSLDRSTATAVLKHADKIELEPWYIMIGPELWRKFIAALQDTPHAEAIAALAQMDPERAHAVVNACVSDPKAATALITRAVRDRK